MSNLLSSLVSSTGALRAFERAMSVTQNNVSNAMTPGYARQRLNLESMPFAPEWGLPGGVFPGDLQSLRSEYAESVVRQQLSKFGRQDQMATALSALEPSLDVSGDSGLSRAMSNLFSAFSAWSVAPNSSTSRQAVLDRAGEMATAFHQVAASLEQAGSQYQSQIRDTVTSINRLGAKLRDYNLHRLSGDTVDPSVDAGIHNALEELAELVDFSAIFQPDGSVSVLVGGQTPLVIGEHLYAIDSAPESAGEAPPVMRIRDQSGNDITDQITGGRLAGMLEAYNRVLASLRGDASQPGALNQLAGALADRINTILTSGRTADDQDGRALFQYDTAHPNAVARTLEVTPGMTTAQLAAIDAGAPYVSNGIPLKLGALASPQTSAGKIGDLTYTEFYGEMVSRVGDEVNQAREQRDTGTQLVSQARNLRNEVSAVSLDEEAITLMQFQRAYQATSQMIRVLSDLTGEAINLIR